MVDARTCSRPAAKPAKAASCGAACPCGIATLVVPSMVSGKIVAPFPPCRASEPLLDTPLPDPRRVLRRQLPQGWRLVVEHAPHRRDLAWLRAAVARLAGSLGNRAQMITEMDRTSALCLVLSRETLAKFKDAHALALWNRPDEVVDQPRRGQQAQIALPQPDP